MDVTGANLTSLQVFNNRDRHVQIYPDDVEVQEIFSVFSSGTKF